MHAPLQTLANLPDGHVAAISALGDGPLAGRLQALGFDQGVAVEVLHRAPFGGDPLAVRVGATTVALSRSLAELVHLEAA